MLFFLLNFSSLFSQTQVERSDKLIVKDGRKYYLHTVESGQNLYRISVAYGVSQKDISEINNIRAGSINSGQILKIPAVGNVSKQIKESRDFLNHTVKRGETVYKIANKYNISTSDIFMHNSSARNGLNIGQIIRIPNVKKRNFEFQDENLFYHTVTSGQTLFSISQLYGVEIKQIKLFNKGVGAGLKIGQVLKIPKVNYDITERLPVFHNYSPDVNEYSYDPLYFEDDDVTPCSKYNFSRAATYKIALMLPLFIDKNLWLGQKYKNKKDRLYYQNTKRFYEIYQGILVALEHLKKSGISIDLHVFDTEKSPTKVREIIANNDLSDFDLFLGPVYSDNVRILSYFAQKHHINLISPLSQNKSLLKSNPFVFEVMPSTSMRIKKASDLLSKLYDTSLVFIYNGTEKERKKINIYKNKLVKSFSVHPDVKEIAIKVLDFNIGGIDFVEDALSVGDENVVIMPTDDEVFATKIIEKLNKLTENYRIKILGSPSWEMFKNINLKYLKNMSFHYISGLFVDYENWRVKSFIQKYRKAYETEPSVYAFEGYDITDFFVNALKKYGRHFQFCLSPYDKLPNRKGLVFDFLFHRAGIYNGFENNGVFILNYDKDYKLEKYKY